MKQTNDQAKPTSAATELEQNHDADALGRLERLVMRATIQHSDFLEVTFDNSEGNTGNNSDTYTFTISTPGGQSCLLNGEEVERFSFSIVGNFELEEFFASIRAIRSLRA